MKGMRMWGSRSNHPQNRAFRPRHILGAVCAGILATSLGTLAACGGSPESKEPTTAQAVSAASVSIALFDANGVRVGEGSGVMIAPNLVLTSGHLISGKHKWVVTSAGGKQQATGSRGMTYDWMKYDSNKAHPRKHDVGVIPLDSPIRLATYPKLVGETSGDGTKATRIRGNGATFDQLGIALGKVKSSPNAWLGDAVTGETLDTGGAVYDSRGILGIVSGRGMTTGKLYVARVDKLVKWLAPKIACAGGATAVRTYAAPENDKSVAELCEDPSDAEAVSALFDRVREQWTQAEDKPDLQPLADAFGIALGDLVCADAEDLGWATCSDRYGTEIVLAREDPEVLVYPVAAVLQNWPYAGPGWFLRHLRTVVRGVVGEPDADA